ncbi:MAG: DUF29 domain-containing protein [Waterburya sp.]
MSFEQLHDRDFYLWIEETKKAILRRDFENMDWDNLYEEVDDMGKSEKRSLESYLERLIAHVLKLQYWDAEKERNYKHWKAEIVNFRRRIKRLIKQNPSFKALSAEIYPEIFQDMVDVCRVEFDIPENNFIELEQIIQENFF